MVKSTNHFLQCNIKFIIHLDCKILRPRYTVNFSLIYAFVCLTNNQFLFSNINPLGGLQ